ncbi:Uncharacterised protein [Metamycoplasma cloacale]|uniref:Uncharacterized protein n=1 Tax=Metamycoplasma cloacale TaxID=92401 RepID=A0A2Z4LLN9_9BACT|nr:hypothetical protein [Metamycoplasma cloacale]AWX42600.1 hypothetical protein DK849_00675 [Metamycoplasma cloacale]VEU79664.1 Uncharacterised protein [Metamycoplasma cloacale]
MNAKENKPKSKRKLGGLTIFFLLFGLFIGTGIIGSVCYIIYRVINPQIQPIIDDINKITKNDENQKIVFNPKYSSDSNDKFNDTFKYGNLSITEYPYAKDNEGNLVYFLGPDGIKMLNEEFKKRAMFGPEINLLRNVYINKDENIDGTDRANGFYLPSTDNIWISLNAFVNAEGINHSWQNESLENRVEMILSVLVHEYMHYVSNSYNTSHRTTDINADTSLLYKKDESSIIARNYANNKKFINSFRHFLGYNETNYDAIPYHPGIEPPDGEFPIFYKWTAYDLFELANLPHNNAKDWNSITLENYYFNNSYYNPTRFSKNVNLGDLKYSFSFEELIPREFLKFAFAGKESNAQLRDKWLNYLYFVNGHYLHLTAIGDDLLKTLGRDRWKRDLLFSTNWVFDEQLKNLKNINGEYLYKYRTIPNYRLNGLFNTYLDLFGYGLPISYVVNNSIDKTANNSIHIGGYIPSNINLAKFEASDKKLLFIKDNNEYVDFNIHTHKNNFIAKTSYLQTYDETKMLKPIVQYNYSYITDEIPYRFFNEFTSSDGRLNVQLWIDANDNKQVESDELIVLANKANTQRFDRVARTITNYRSSMSWDSKTYTTYSLKYNREVIDATENYYFTWKKY